MSNQSFHYQSYVHRDWVDYNGHMNDAAYATVFSLAVDHLMDHIGLNAEARSHYAYTIFTLENHICYLQEAHQDEELSVSMQLLDADAKRLHVLFMMKNNENQLLATSEQMLMGMDTEDGRPAPFPERVASEVEAIWNGHKHLAQPEQAGRRIGIKR
ncbi:thioesterase family protein [Virgibacillus doumboii]|uniref:thioesterase family protein n=1 Tax=Virgibacillus doumboii TaxID=2697503 RepID=UPI0013DE85FC|nr:thioesterase family protein [Virgibacillus doumboii]